MFIITNEIIFIILICHNIQVFSMVIIFQVRGIYLEHLFRSSFMFVKVVYFLINLIYKKSNFLFIYYLHPIYLFIIYLILLEFVYLL